MLVWSYQHGAFMSKVLSSFSVAHNGLIIHICTRYLCIYTYTRINRHTLHTYTHSPYSFVFYIGVELINNVVLMSGVQQSDSVIHIYVSILFQILFPFRLFQKIERSSLCDTVDPCWLSILNIAVCTCQSQAPILSFPPPFSPPVTIIVMTSVEVSLCSLIRILLPLCFLNTSLYFQLHYLLV